MPLVFTCGLSNLLHVASAGVTSRLDGDARPARQVLLSPQCVRQMTDKKPKYPLDSGMESTMSFTAQKELSAVTSGPAKTGLDAKKRGRAPLTIAVCQASVGPVLGSICTPWQGKAERGLLIAAASTLPRAGAAALQFVSARVRWRKACEVSSAIVSDRHCDTLADRQKGRDQHDSPL